MSRKVMRSLAGVQIGVGGEEGEHRRLDAPDRAAVERDADQQPDHALRDRLHVMFRARIMRHPREFAPHLRPARVVAREVILIDERAVADDDDAMRVRRPQSGEPGSDRADPRRIEPRAFGRGHRPAVAQRCPRAALRSSGSDRGKNDGHRKRAQPTNRRSPDARHEIADCSGHDTARRSWGSRHHRAESDVKQVADIAWKVPHVLP